MTVAPPREIHARELFDGISGFYGTPAELFSFGQYGRWRREAVRHLDVARDSRVLDVATGTGLVARDIAKRYRARVIGLDQSQAMLERARRLGVSAVRASAVALPFPDASFDGLSFTYLLRYVDDVEATIAELVRVLKPGACMVSVEFGRPSGALTAPLWNLYTLGVFPLATRAISRGWRTVGEFLGPSIASFNAAWPPERLVRAWESAGMIGVRYKQMSVGGGVVTWGRKAA